MTKTNLIRTTPQQEIEMLAVNITALTVALVSRGVSNLLLSLLQEEINKASELLRPRVKAIVGRFEVGIRFEEEKDTFFVTTKVNGSDQDITETEVCSSAPAACYFFASLLGCRTSEVLEVWETAGMPSVSLRETGSYILSRSEACLLNTLTQHLDGCPLQGYPTK